MCPNDYSGGKCYLYSRLLCNWWGRHYIITKSVLLALNSWDGIQESWRNARMSFLLPRVSLIQDWKPTTNKTLSFVVTGILRRVSCCSLSVCLSVSCLCLSVDKRNVTALTVRRNTAPAAPSASAGRIFTIHTTSSSICIWPQFQIVWLVVVWWVDDLVMRSVPGLLNELFTEIHNPRF